MLTRFANKQQMFKFVVSSRMEAIYHGANTIFENINTISDYGFWSDEGQEAVERIYNYDFERCLEDVNEAILGEIGPVDARYPLTSIEKEIVKVLYKSAKQEVIEELESMDEMQEILEERRIVEEAMRDSIKPAPLD